MWCSWVSWGWKSREGTPSSPPAPTLAARSIRSFPATNTPITGPRVPPPSPSPPPDPRIPGPPLPLAPCPLPVPGLRSPVSLSLSVPKTRTPLPHLTPMARASRRDPTSRVTRPTISDSSSRHQRAPASPRFRRGGCFFLAGPGTGAGGTGSRAHARWESGAGGSDRVGDRGVVARSGDRRSHTRPHSPRRSERDGRDRRGRNDRRDRSHRRDRSRRSRHPPRSRPHPRPPRARAPEGRRERLSSLRPGQGLAPHRLLHRPVGRGRARAAGHLRDRRLPRRRPQARRRRLGRGRCGHRRHQHHAAARADGGLHAARLPHGARHPRDRPAHLLGLGDQAGAHARAHRHRRGVRAPHRRQRPPRVVG